MPFIHNRNKHGRQSFSLGVQTDESAGDRFNVFVYRAGIHREYLPGRLSTYRIQALLDSSLFRPRIRIELDRYKRENHTCRYYDYIDIEIS